MGQAYVIYNKDKKQYLDPHAFGHGYKLLEFGSSGGGILTALTVLLAESNGRGSGDLNSDNPIVGSWAGDRIITAGDYGDTFVDDCMGEDMNLYQVATKLGEDVSVQAMAALLDDTYLRRDFEEQDEKYGYEGSSLRETLKKAKDLKAEV